MLIDRIASLEQSLYWLRKRIFGRMSEKSLPLDPNQLLLFSKEEMSSMEVSRMEGEVRKSEEEITKTIKVKEKPVRKPLDTSAGLRMISLKSERKRVPVWNVFRQKSIS